MRELIRLAWPVVLSAVLVVLIAGLRLVSKNAPRSSRRYRLRVTLLATLVGLSGGLVLSGCEADAGGKDPVPEQQPAVDATDAVALPDAGEMLCYKDVGVQDLDVATPPDSAEPDVAEPEVTMTCYADVGPQEPDLEVTPEAVTPEAQPEATPEAVTPPEPSDVEGDPSTPDVDDETIMCYDPIAPDTKDQG